MNMHWYADGCRRSTQIRRSLPRENWREAGHLSNNIAEIFWHVLERCWDWASWSAEGIELQREAQSVDGKERRDHCAFGRKSTDNLKGSPGEDRSVNRDLTFLVASAQISKRTRFIAGKWNKIRSRLILKPGDFQNRSFGTACWASPGRKDPSFLCRCRSFCHAAFSWLLLFTNGALYQGSQRNATL